MAQPLSEEQRQQWQEIILKQRASGLSIAKWCRENNLAVHVFYHRQRILFPKPPLQRTSFTEVSQEIIQKTSNKTGITLDYQGILILLDKNFDVQSLKQCLAALKEISC
jgi:hypothetical protein